MMLYYKVKPILVFDGGYLPSKSEKEAERRQYGLQQFTGRGVISLNFEE